MKKILPLALLLLVFALPGCRSGSPNTCFFSGLFPNSTYLFVFNLTGGGTQSVIGVTSNTGSVVVIKPINGACNNVQIILRLYSNYTLSSNPSSIDLTSPPSTVTITGQSFDTTYGMPRVDYYDGDGYLVGSAYATSVSGSTSLTANVPDLSDAYSGSYQIKVSNMTSSGYYSHEVGSADVSAYGRDRLDSDGDGYYDDEDCDPYDPTRDVYCNDCPGNPTQIICE